MMAKYLRDIVDKELQPNKTCVIVARESDASSQEDSVSIEAQLITCRKKAAELQLMVVAEYIDAAISGALLLGRPGMQHAIADIKAGRANVLISLNIARYSRDTEHQQRIKREVRAAGGSLVFCDIVFADTPEGDLQFTVLGGFAEYERKVIRTRTSNGRRAWAEKGVQTCRSRAPFGLKIVQHDDVTRGQYPAHELGRYYIVEKEAAIVRWLFESYAAGTHTMPQLARELNEAKVPTPKGGAHWRSASIHDMFTNPAFVGRPTFGRTQSCINEGRLQEPNQRTGQFFVTARLLKLAPPERCVTLSAPAIVSEQTWQRVQQRLAENKAKKGGNPQLVRMLAGRIFCPKCGSPMTVGTCSNTAYSYYLCSRSRKDYRETGIRQCDPTGYRIQMVEEAAIAALIELCQKGETITAAITAYSQRPRSEISAQEVRKELRDLDAKLQNLATRERATAEASIQAHALGGDIEVYQTIQAENALEKKDLQDQRGQLARMIAQAPTLNGKSPVAALNIPVEFLENVERVLSSQYITPAERRDFIGLVVDRVKPESDGAIVQFSEGILGASTLQNVCMQCKVRAGKCEWSIEAT